MNCKNKKILSLALLLLLQTAHADASEQGQERHKNISIAKAIMWTSLGLFVGYQVGKFIRATQEKYFSNTNEYPYYTYNVPNNIHSITINSLCSNVQVTGSNRGNSIDMSGQQGDYHVAAVNGILTINNNTNNNIACDVPSNKMIAVSTFCGDIAIDNVNFALANVVGAGSIHLKNIKCGIFGHTNCGNIDVSINKKPNTPKIVYLTAGVGTIYFKVPHKADINLQIKANTEYRRNWWRDFYSAGPTIAGVVTTGLGKVIIEEV